MPTSPGVLFISTNQLIALSRPTLLPRAKPYFLEELRLRRRECRARAKHIARRSYKPFLPSVIMGNVRSLPNKMDELATKMQQEYSESNIMYFTETWLHGHILDANVTSGGQYDGLHHFLCGQHHSHQDSVFFPKQYTAKTADLTKCNNLIFRFKNQNYLHYCCLLKVALWNFSFCVDFGHPCGQRR